MKIGNKVLLPKASDFNSAQDYFDHISNSRDECDKRGYHRVIQDNKDPIICYDCDLWFDKESSKSSGIKYKIENPF